MDLSDYTDSRDDSRYDSKKDLHITDEERQRILEVLHRSRPEPLRVSIRELPEQKRTNDPDRDPEKLVREKRQRYERREKDLFLNQQQIALMNDVGCFRTVKAQDLIEHVYKGDEHAFQTDLRSLLDQDSVTVTAAPGQDRTKYLSLTKNAKEFLDGGFKKNSEQTIYAGMVKPRELEHDAAVYRVYQAEKKNIENRGGQVKRVVLDFELKKKINRELAKVQDKTPRELDAAKKSLAREYRLQIVQGKIQIPDVRIEYEAPDRSQGSVDLEYVSSHYTRRQIATKAAAGFKLYGEAGRGRRAAQAQDLISDILSL